MGKVFKAILIGLLGTLVSNNCPAQIIRGGISGSALFGQYAFESKQRLDDGDLLDLRLGYNLTENWGVEGVFNYVDTQFDFIDVGVDGYLFHVDGLYHFLPEQKFVPYLGAGIGGINLEFDRGGSDSGFLFNWGGGIKLFVWKSLALRADIRHVIAYSNTLNNFAFTGGITYQFGGEKEKEPTELLDSDGDGVNDRFDTCPGTPAGTPVDSTGCPVDTDKDGVFDHLDMCPETLPSMPVDERGCPADSDGDGIIDLDDRCPGTPPRNRSGRKGMPSPAGYTRVHDDERGIRIKQRGDKSRIPSSSRKSSKLHEGIPGHEGGSGGPH